MRLVPFSLVLSDNTSEKMYHSILVVDRSVEKAVVDFNSVGKNQVLIEIS